MKKTVLVFTGGESPEPKKAEGFLRHILAGAKKPDFVVAADSGLETLAAWQEFFAKEYDLAPGAILGDFDSLRDKKLLERYDERIIERHPAYKDLTDTEMAMQKAKDFSKCAFIVLVGGSGGSRADHFLGIFNLFGTKLSPDAWVCGEQVFYKAERGTLFIDGLKKGDAVSVARTAQKNSGGKILSSGLEWESPLFRKKGMPSVSNAIKEEYELKKTPVQISVARGRFVLILPLSASVRLSGRNTEK